MTKLYLPEHQLILLVLSMGAWLTVGALIGSLYFLTLRWNVRMFTIGQSLPLALVTQLVRFALIADVLAIITSHFGALPLLVATAGILATRTAVVRFGVQP
jgi:F1F0 ATPase subunit 2